MARSFGISSIESDQPGDQRVEPVGRRAGQHAVSFCKASLAATELREPYECVGVPAGTEPAQLADTRGELVVRALPVPVPEQNIGVVRPADREHLAVVETRCDLAHALAPLVRALQVAYPLASVDHEAADRLDRVDLGHLASDRGRGGSVELPHAFVDAAAADEGEPFERERQHLDVDGTNLAGDRTCLRRPGACRLRIVLCE